MDPLAGKYPSFSPYNYTLNNPINYIDPDGKKTIPWYLLRFLLRQGAKSIGKNITDRHSLGGAEREIIVDKNGKMYFYIGNDKNGNPLYTDGFGNIYTEKGAENGTPSVVFEDSDDILPDYIELEPEKEEQEEEKQQEEEEKQKEKKEETNEDDENVQR